MTIHYGGGKQTVGLYDLRMHEVPPEKLDTFISEILEELGGDAPTEQNNRVLAACKDVTTDNYLILMAVPASALSDGTGPEVYRTSNEKKFLAAFNEEELFIKAEQILEENPNSTDEEKNELIAEYLAGFMPALFERAAELPELTF